MKTKITKPLALLAAVCGLQLFAATTAWAEATTPAVVWEGVDLRDGKSFTVNNKTYTLNLNGNEVTDGYVQIKDNNDGVYFTITDANGALTTLQGMTVIARVSNYSVSDADANRALISFQAKGQTGNLHNIIGLGAMGNGRLRELWGGVNYYTTSSTPAAETTTGLVPTALPGNIGCSWKRGGTADDRVLMAGSTTMTTGLASSQSACDLSGAYIGGKDTAYSDYTGTPTGWTKTGSAAPVSGLRVYGIAVFADECTAATMTSYKFQLEANAPVAVWTDFHTLTSGGYEWTNAGGTVNDDGSFTVGTGGLAMTLPTTSNIYKNRRMTMVIDAEVPAQTAENAFLDILASGNHVSVTRDATKMYQCWNAGTSTRYGECTAPTTRKTFTISYNGYSNKIDDRGTYTYFDGAPRMANQGLMTGSNNITKFAIGHYIGDTISKVAAGVKIYSIALYDENGRTLPTMWWKFNNNFDRSGFASASVGGEATSNFVQARYDKAMKVVDGSTHPWGSGWAYGNRDWTATVVAMPVANASNKIVLWTSGSKSGWAGLLSDSANKKIIFAYGNADGPTEICSTTLPDDFDTAYHLYTVQRDANGNFKVFVDQNISGAGTGTYATQLPTGNYQIGAVNGGLPTGLARTTGTLIDDLRVYSYTLSEAELKSVYNEFFPSVFSATVTGDASWSALGWTPAMPSVGSIPADSEITLTNNGAADVTTVAVDATVNCAKLKVVSATKVLKFGSPSKLNPTAYDFSKAPGGVGFGVTGGWTVSDPLKTYIRNNAVKVFFYSDDTNGATLDYGTGNTTSLSGHYVFDGGSHAFTWGGNASEAIFSSTGTLDNPVLLTKSGTTLNFTMRDLCGWNGSFVEGSTIRVATGATMNILPSGDQTMYMRGRLVLEPGSTTTYKTGSGDFRIYGGSDQAGTDVAKAQIYVPAPTTANKVATFSKNAQSKKNLDFSKSAAAISVDGDATLDFNTPFSGSQEIKKYGTGTLKLLGAVNGYTSKLSTMAGKLVIACGGTVPMSQWVASGSIIEFTGDSDATVSGQISGSGAVKKTGTGTVTLTGANNYTGETTVEAGMLAAATANLGTGLVTINDGATLKLILTEAQVEGSSTVFKSSQDAATLQARVTIVNEAGVTIPGNFSKGENDAVVFTPSVELYSLTITDGQTLNWGDNIWTKGGQGGQPYAPAEGKVGDVTITVNGTATLNVTGTPAQLGGIKFVKADGASTANITVKYATTTPPTSSAVNVSYNVFGMVPTVGDGVTYAFEPALDATKFAWECNQAAGTFFATKRPEMGSISIKIGARTEDSGKILTSLESVGAVQLSGLLWTNAKLYTNTTASDPGYTDIGKVSDANGSDRQVRYAFRGPNTYWSASDSSTGNAVLTKTYVDDGGDAASKTWTISDESKLPGESVTLPAAPNARGWQIHLDNLPYAAFDLYFITASDQAAANLKETPILLSANGGTTWVSYTADTVNHKTVLGDSNWTGQPWTSGQLTEGLNYLKMRVSAAIMGVEQISALEITHGTRNTGSFIRSGLCAIQIVELDNDGAFTLTGNGNWTTDAIWSSGGQAGKTWESGEESYATILSSDTINAVTVDGNVTAKKVTLKGTHDFALDGANTITSEMGIDAAEFTGALTLKAPVVGPISLNSDATIVFNNADTETPVEGAAYAFTGSAAFKKTGAGAYTLNATGVTGMTVEAGTLKLGADCTISGTIEVQSGATLDLNGHSLAGLTITGAGTVTGSFAGGTLAPAADTTLTFSGTVAENATLTINGEGTVRITSAQANGTIAVTAGTLEATSLKTLSLGANATLKIAKDATLTLTDVPTFNAASKIIIADAASLVEGNNYKLVTWTNWPNCDLLSYGMPQLEAQGYTGAEIRLVPGVYDLTLQCRTAAQVARKPLVIMPIGDSITEGLNNKDGSGKNYRIPLFNKLSLAGYNVKSVGFWTQNGSSANGSYDPSGTIVTNPDWIFHSGKGSMRAGAKSGNGMVFDALLNDIDVAGSPDIVLLHIGINDMLNNASGHDDPDGVKTYQYITNMVTRAVNAHPEVTFVISSPMCCEYGHQCQTRPSASSTEGKDKNKEFVTPLHTMMTNFYAQAKLGNIPGVTAQAAEKIYFADMYENVMPRWYGDQPDTFINDSSDKCHPNWLGHELMAQTWFDQITNAFQNVENPDGHYNADPAEVPETALGATNNVPAAYREGYVLARVFRPDPTERLNTVITGHEAIPYDYVNPDIDDDQGISKVAYFFEYVRPTVTTNLHRWVWADMDAFDTRVDQVGVPTNDHQAVVKNLHICGNHPAVWNIGADDNSVKGFVEFTPHGIGSGDAGVTGGPAKWCNYSWNDEFGTSLNYGCMQVHRMIDGGDMGREAQVVFAYNGFTSLTTYPGYDYGIGNFSQSFMPQSMDWTFMQRTKTLSSTNLTYRSIEVWVKIAPTGNMTAEVTGEKNWSDITWTDAKGNEWTGLAGAYSYTLTGSGTTTLNTALADGATVAVNGGTLNLADGASIGATSSFSIAADATLGVTTTNVVLKASKVTNNGTIAFNGGTAENPIEITGDATSNFGTMTLAANTHVYNKATANRKHLVTGVGATSYYYLDGHGLSDDTSLNNLTLVSLATGNGVWIERGIGENIRLTVPEGKAVTIGNNDLTYNAPFIALNGAGTINPKKNSTLTIDCSEAAEFSGTSSIGITIGGTEVQTLSGNYTGALTVQTGGQVKLTGSAVPSSITSAGTVTFDYGAGTTKTVSLTSTGTVNILSGTVIFRDYRGAVTLGTDAKVGYTVDINDCGEFTVPQGVDINSVDLYRADGTKIDTTAEGGKLTYTWEITGSACYWDYEFNEAGTMESGEVGPINTGTEGPRMRFDGNRPDAVKGKEYVTNIVETAAGTVTNIAIRLPARPWRDVSSWPSAMTFVFYSQMVGTDKAYEISFGSRNNSGIQLFFATKSVADGTVDLCLSVAGAAPTILCTMSVQNAQDANHLYAVVLKKDASGNSVVNTYLDGELLQPYTHSGAITLGAGFQIASGHGDPCTGYGRPADDDPATMDWLRVYNVELSQKAMTEYANLYPYTSTNGKATRTVTEADTKWVEEGKWTQALYGGGSFTTNTPNESTSVELTVGAATSLELNLSENAKYESMKIKGDAALTLTKGTNEDLVVPSVPGTTTIGTDVTVDYDAIILGNVKVEANKTLTFDLSNLDLTKVYANTNIQLTGAAVLEEGATITTNNLTAVRGHEVTLVVQQSQYHLNIAVTPEPFIYTIAQGEATGKWSCWGVDLAAEPDWAAVGSGEIQKAGDGEATFAPQAGMVYTIAAGTLKFSEVPTADCLVTNVAEGATFDLNGLQPGSASEARGFVVTLNGGTLANSSASQGIVKGLTLVKDSTVDVASGNIWIQSGAGGYSRITLALGTYTLTKTGSGQFGVVETDVTGTGTIDIQAGMLWVQESSNFGTATVKVGANGTFSVRESKTATVANVNGVGGTITVAGTITGFELSGTLNLAGNGSYGTITNAANAVANIGTRHNYYTFSGAGSVKAKFSTNPQPGDVVTIFKVADSATTGIAELKKSDDSVIPASYYTVANGVVTFKKEATDGTIFYFTLKQAIEEQTGAATIALVKDITDAQSITVGQSITLEGDTNILANVDFAFSSATLTFNSGCIGVDYVAGMNSASSICRFAEAVTNSWASHGPAEYSIAKLSTPVRADTTYQYEFVKSAFVPDPTKGEELVPVVDEKGNDAGAIKLNSEWVATKTPGATTAAEQAIALNTKQTNNLMKWQNEVLGLDGTKSESKPVVAPVQGTSTTQITFKLGGCDVAKDSGATVKYKVLSADTPSATTWTPASDETAYNANASVDLPTSGVKYYKFDVIIDTSK